MRQWTQWHNGLNDSVLSACTHTQKHAHTRVHINTPSSLGGKTAAGEALSREGLGQWGLICPDVSDLSFLLNITDLLQFHMPTLRHCQRTQEQLKIKKSNRNQWGCSGTCCTIWSIFSSHSRQEENTSLINHIEFHSQTLGDAADFKMNRNKEPDSLYVVPKMVIIPTYLLNVLFLRPPWSFPTGPPSPPAPWRGSSLVLLLLWYFPPPSQK